jgi:hypothetical protein
MKQVHKPQEQQQQQHNECVHEWRFLNLKAPIERKAFEAGNVEVCVKCQELKGWND